MTTEWHKLRFSHANAARTLIMCAPQTAKTPALNKTQHGVMTFAVATKKSHVPMQGRNRGSERKQNVVNH